MLYVLFTSSLFLYWSFALSPDSQAESSNLTQYWRTITVQQFSASNTRQPLIVSVALPEIWGSFKTWVSVNQKLCCMDGLWHCLGGESSGAITGIISETARQLLSPDSVQGKVTLSCSAPTDASWGQEVNTSIGYTEQIHYSTDYTVSQPCQLSYIRELPGPQDSRVVRLNRREQ